MDLLINISGYTTNETPFESGCQITPAGDKIAILSHWKNMGTYYIA